MIEVGMYRFSQLKTNSVGIRKRWVCSKWCKGCRSVIITIENEIVMYKNEHNH